MNRLVRLERWLCLAGLGIAGFLLGALVLLSGLNVFGRLLGHPIGGSYEISGFLGALIASLALADTQRKRGHVELDMFTRRYKPLVKRLVGAFNMFCGFLLLLVLAIQQINRAKRLLAAGELSETLRIQYPWLMYACAGGLLLLACAYLTDCVYLLTRKDPDTEALTSGERKGVVTSIRNDVVLPGETTEIAPAGTGAGEGDR
ncbi:MAG: TRAP transporter small permease [Victivallales bacterium]|nr:TRAP transporter small permease [Victivallales bacterium]